MSIKAIAWTYTVEATPQERNVLFTLALYADEKYECFPSINTIAEVSRMPRSNTIRSLNSLAHRGFVERISKGTWGAATHYRLRVPKMGLLLNAQSPIGDTLRDPNIPQYIGEDAERYPRDSRTNAQSPTGDTRIINNIFNLLINDVVLESQKWDSGGGEGPQDETPDESIGEITPYQKLHDTFVNKTHLSPTGSNTPKWNETLNRMVKKNITPEILSTAIDELTKKDYNLSGPWSVENACANVMRKNGGKKEEPPTWSQEEYDRKKLEAQAEVRRLRAAAKETQ